MKRFETRPRVALGASSYYSRLPLLSMIHHLPKLVNTFFNKKTIFSDRSRKELVQQNPQILAPDLSGGDSPPALVPLLAGRLRGYKEFSPCRFPLSSLPTNHS